MFWKKIRVDQKSDLKLVDQSILINQGDGGDFRIDENDVMRFRSECVYQMFQKLRRVFLKRDIEVD